MAIRYLSGINVDSNTLFVNSSNDFVGVGTNLPSAKLQVSGAVKITGGDWPSGYAGLEFNYVSNTSYIGSYDRTNSVYKGLFLFADNMTFETGASIRMYIASGGNIGIGNTSPNGALAFADDARTRKIVLWDGAANNDYQFYGFGVESSTMIQSIYAGGDRFLWVSGASDTARNELMVLTGGGNLGIGTTSPTSVLHVNGANNTAPVRIQAGDNANYYFSGNSTSGYAVDFLINDTAFYIGHNSASRDFTFKTNSIDRVTIKGGGNVGIGTTAPTATLTIGTNEDIQSTIGIGLGVNQSSLEFVHATFQNGFGSKFYSVDSGNGVTSLRLAVRANSTTWSDAMTIIAGTSGGGNIGIGTTSPSYTLDVAGQSRFGSGAKAIVGTDGTYGGYSTIGFGGTTNGYNRVFGYDGTGDGLYLTAATGQGMAFWTNGSSLRMFITAAGNVLIGTQVDYSRLTISNGASTRSGITISDANTASLMMFAGASAPASISFDTFGLRFVGGSTAGTDNGSEFMRITTAGNVGIGTTSPNTKLRIVDSTTNPPLSIQNTNADGYSGSWLYDSAGTLVGHWGWANGTTTALSDKMYFGTIANKPVVFTTNDSEKVRITAAGNVGIGTTSPSNRLTVYQGGGVRVTGIASGDWIEMSGNLPGYTDNQYPVIKSNGTIHFANNNKYSAYLEGANTYFGILDSTTTTRVFLTTSGNSYLTGGNVGIGTTAPTQRLQVAGNEVTDSKINALGTVYGAGAFLNAFSSAGGNDVGFAGFIASQLNQTNRMWTGVHSPSGANQAFIGTPDAMPIAFWTNSTEQMRITSAGNVGIGTTSPSYLLDINGTARATTFLVNNATNSTGLHITSNAPSAGGAVIRIDKAAADRQSYITFDADQLYLGVPASNTTVGEVGTKGSVDLRFATNYTERMRITSAGNVGIGTTSPASPLQISAASVLSQGVLSVVNTYASGGVYYPAARFVNQRGDHSFGIVSEFYTGATSGSDRPSILFNTGNSSNSWQVGMVTSGWGGNDSFGIGYRANNDPASFNAWPTARFLITTDGNVGIGTTAPNAKLDVSGGITLRNTRVSTDEKYPVGHYSFGETVFEIDPTWSQEQLQDFFGSTGATWIADSTAPGGYAIQVDGQINVGGEYNSGFPYIPVDSSQDDWYYMECYIRNDSGSSIQHYMGGIDYNQSFSSLGGNPGSFTYNVMFNYNPGTSWTKVYGYWNGFGNSYGSAGTGNTNNWESGTKYFTPQALFNYGLNSGIRRCYISGWKCVRVRATGNRYFTDNVLVNGNIGIGTTSPDKKLVVIGEGTGTAKIGSAVFNSGNYTGISLNGTLSTGDYNILSSPTDKTLYINRPSGVGIQFREDNQVQMLIQSGGNVGIGTTSPNTKLHLWTGTTGNSIEALRLTSSYAGTGDGPLLRFTNYLSYATNPNAGEYNLAGIRAFDFASAWGGGLQFLTAIDTNGGGNLTAAMTITSAQNVGIGTTSPSEKLHVDGNVIVTYNNSFQGINSIGNKAILARVSPTTGIINYAEYATATNLNGFVMGSDDARVKGNIATDSLEFITNGSTQAFIDSSGNVGIGTTSPTQKLDVAGIIRGTSSNPYVIRAKTSSGSNSFISFEDPVNASNDQVYCGSEGNNFIIGTNYAEKLRVNSSGNVGIGTTSISYRVDISGDARILSGSLGVGVAPNATDGRIDASNDIVAYSTSDQRLKENVTPIENALEKVKTLTGVEFDWKEETAHVHGYHGHDVGIIAQDVQAVLPEAVRTNESGYLSVRYEKMIALLIEANKELAARVEFLEQKLKQ